MLLESIWIVYPKYQEDLHKDAVTEEAVVLQREVHLAPLVRAVDQLAVQHASLVVLLVSLVVRQSVVHLVKDALPLARAVDQYVVQHVRQVDQLLAAADQPVVQHVLLLERHVVDVRQV